ncbi:dephospho-CoA kinase [Vibrio sp. SCSIO 43136]|uniref:dephospho-CoA kinase n=1 Tax=Vibrio sp. SCSIO 43136 TaxID=2819101 RepID=UPI002074B7BE|nr:dephospho-CoA kinase [Vibrio sp. SCSIO 43136]USD64857.1 dephospho-CoA kinase [Vibrio sp. SCSIO 43136]
MAKPFIVGLTGGIASGKTTVANLFAERYGIDLIDADIVAREVVEPGSEGLKQIAAHFGPDVIQTDGNLDRAKLRECIFSDPEQKTWLNALLHPMIRQRMQEQMAQVSSPYGLLVVPLLIENDLTSMTDRVLVVDVDRKLQLQRTMQRDNVSAEQVKAILASQCSREQRLAKADDVITNQGSSEQLVTQIEKLHQNYLEYCR